VADFGLLYELLEFSFVPTGHGRPCVLGGEDAFFLFLHWLGTGTAIRTIAAVFRLKAPTLSARMLSVAAVTDTLLVRRLVEASEPFSAGEICSTCGLVVDATIQERDRPGRGFERANTYYSGKHHMYCIKSQVVARRDGITVHITSGVPNAIHDIKLFRNTIPSLERLIASHPGEPVQFLADKGYIGPINSPSIILHTPIKDPIRGVLSQEEAKYNKRHSKQ
jgi:hypothetical protein